MKILIVIFILISAYSQAQDTLKDCNCIKKGECIQYLDSMFKPTLINTAVYKRYNYKRSNWSYEISEFLWGDNKRIEISGKRYLKDTINFVDGKYKWFDQGKLICEANYDKGYPIKLIYHDRLLNETLIVDFLKNCNMGRWSYVIELYKYDKIWIRKYYTYKNGKSICYKKEKFDIESSK